MSGLDCIQLSTVPGVEQSDVWAAKTWTLALGFTY
ncbi:hypothetical protein CA13_04400 [Planctomycetes bacterium CA13]|uniref:Uncharacterized protein n=1 Tax=Novipirellula herctigrandis TaxID=2527986 RepID=A0A5C5YWX0_9BACT|nr:hypothetical protein CA13_04400 [Planctomycetes bacterium CA13]